jgi:thiol-disulfide isomerase/thioredoxin
MMIRFLVMFALVWTAAASLAAKEAAWTQNYETAKARAQAGGKPILALFTGSDWCPPCKEFERDVATSDGFLRFTADKVVLLKLDYPHNMLQAPELIAQNEALAERIGGEEFPRFYLLDAKGEVLVKLNTRVRRAAKDYADFIEQALAEGLAEVKKTAAQ